MLKWSIIFIAILVPFIIIGCGEDQLYAPVRGDLKIVELRSSLTELDSGDEATIECQVEYTGQETFLSYTWSATDGNIAGNGKQIIYTAPEESGVQTITITVTDGDVIDQQSLSILVKAISHKIAIASKTHWLAKELDDALLYEVTVDEVFSDKIELKYDIIQDQDKADAFLSIIINGTPVLAQKAVGGFIAEERTIDKIDVSNFIPAPGKYTLEFLLELTNLVDNGWLLNEAKLLRLEGTSSRIM